MLKAGIYGYLDWVYFQFTSRQIVTAKFNESAFKEANKSDGTKSTVNRTLPSVVYRKLHKYLQHLKANKKNSDSGLCISQ